ncbi:hypothetical protein ACFV98_09115 [Streptomyces violascens]|uniref:hypothetical protein n=1 Tax=Streptomyces violascens TaxID=67381 RepID=UPI003661620D
MYRDVEELLGHTFRLTRGATGRAVVGLMADAQADASLARRLQEEVIAPAPRGPARDPRTGC